VSSALSPRGLGGAAGGLFRPTIADTETPVESPVVEQPANVEESRTESESPKRRRRRVVGTRVVKINLPAALAERLTLVGIQTDRRPSVVVAELLEKHLPKLAIRQG
jgi:hypothetical protein